ncbi:hypothetical protein [Weissella minor]|uniref:hypothetical protein n=1 Tax=Weissella minor TaxID=1620 RepID=UPI001BAFED45|nr:hypothetical protein [Weissella minor]
MAFHTKTAHEMRPWAQKFRKEKLQLNTGENMIVFVITMTIICVGIMYLIVVQFI